MMVVKNVLFIMSLKFKNNNNLKSLNKKLINIYNRIFLLSLYLYKFTVLKK